MANIIIYSTGTCPYCINAKELLDSKGVQYKEIRIDKEEGKRDEMLRISNGRRTVPQIFIDNKHIGGFDDLKSLNDKGELDPLLHK